MLGNFRYYNPTKLYFGEDSIKYLKDELANVGKNVVIVYGKSSIKKMGLYDEVISILKEAGKNIAEISGVMPNPTIDKLYEGVEICRKHKADFLLAVGGGSVCDYTKGVAVSIHCKEDPWNKYYLRFEEPDCDVVPLGCILTMAGTGSEMNTGSVITNPHTKLKLGQVFRDPRVFPKFSILNPRYTMSLPHYQVVAGCYDIFSHISEQYFSGEDDNSSDYLAEALMKSVIHSSRIANKNLEDYEARSNIMWDATWALNTLIGKGKSQDWNVHMLGQAVSGVTDATHGMTLAAVSLPYYKFIMEAGLAKFVRFAKNVWGIDEEGKTPLEVAQMGLNAMENWMKEIGLVLSLRELGVNEENLEDVVNGTFPSDSGYKVLTKDDVRNILKAAL